MDDEFKFNMTTRSNDLSSTSAGSHESQQVQQIGYTLAATYIPKADDPLREPIVKSTMQKIQISGSQLINMSVKDLNRRLSHCSASVVAKLKRCRRTLKNRGYAKNCRIKRIAARHQLEHINSRLASENKELRQRNKLLMEQVESMKLTMYRASVTNNNNPQIGATLNHQNPDVVQRASTYDNQKDYPVFNAEQQRLSVDHSVYSSYSDQTDDMNSIDIDTHYQPTGGSSTSWSQAIGSSSTSTGVITVGPMDSMQIY